MNKSESIKNIADALSKFQGEIENPKNTADNPFFKSKYAPLQEVLNIVRPKLAKYGLSILQWPSGDGERIIINSLLMHSSGEWIEMEPLILKAEKATAQGAGSAITYGRRYALSAILGISSEDDDDGSQASSEGSKSATAKAASRPRPVPNTEDKPNKEIFNCESCGIEITKAEKSYSEHYYGKLLCKNCQKTYQKLK